MPTIRCVLYTTLLSSMKKSQNHKNTTCNQYCDLETTSSFCPGLGLETWSPKSQSWSRDLKAKVSVLVSRPKKVLTTTLHVISSKFDYNNVKLLRFLTTRLCPRFCWGTSIQGAYSYKSAVWYAFQTLLVPLLTFIIYSCNGMHWNSNTTHAYTHLTYYAIHANHKMAEKYNDIFLHKQKNDTYFRGQQNHRFK